MPTLLPMIPSGGQLESNDGSHPRHCAPAVSAARTMDIGERFERQSTPLACDRHRAPSPCAQSRAQYWRQETSGPTTSEYVRIRRGALLPPGNAGMFARYRHTSAFFEQEQPSRRGVARKNRQPQSPYQSAQASNGSVSEGIARVGIQAPPDPRGRAPGATSIVRR